MSEKLAKEKYRPILALNASEIGYPGGPEARNRLVKSLRKQYKDDGHGQALIDNYTDDNPWAGWRTKMKAAANERNWDLVDQLKEQARIDFPVHARLFVDN
ncbi:hypothetical protein HY030_00935 [Candidatus Gottesmanbacteria bacterium]|nr:hypothetical protein [Candidatus Gottesmanbacteria bacterium]